jgi:hypothetical protein
MPSISSAAADAGAIDALVEVLEAQQAATATANSRHAGGAAKLAARAGGDGAAANATVGGVARQACMAIRNMVVRNPELRAPFLERGAEPLVRGVKGRFGVCGDVGSAALRDLGLDQYL